MEVTARREYLRHVSVVECRSFVTFPFHFILIPHCVTTVYKVPHLVYCTSSVGEKAQDIEEKYVGTL